MNRAREIALLNKNHKVYAHSFSFATQEEQRDCFSPWRQLFVKTLKCQV